MLPGLFQLLLDELRFASPETREAILRELGITETPEQVYQRLEHATWHRSGLIRMIHRDLQGAIIKQAEFHNQITDGAHNLVRDALYGQVTDLAIKYMAVGTGNSSPAHGQTQLDAEIYRQQPTSFTPGSTGVLTTTTVIGPSSAIATWGEVGWFAGALATSSANTGVMVARVLYAHSHTNQESVQGDRQDTQA